MVLAECKFLALPHDSMDWSAGTMTKLKKHRASWRQALLPSITIVLLVLLKSVATPMYATVSGHFPAMMIEIMASRSILFFQSPAGYYEKLLTPGHNDWKTVGVTFVPDAFRGRRLQPNLASATVWPATNSPTNRFGYVGPDWTLNKPPDTRRVAVLGDSVTQGVGVDSDQSFVTLLANRLNADQSPHRKQFEFLNFAVSGYESEQIMDVALHDVPQFQPDLYILMLTELPVYRSWDRHLIYLVQTGADPKYDFLRQILTEANAKQTDDQATLDAKFAPFRISVLRQTILTMKTNADQRHAQFLVVLVPAGEDADISRLRFGGIPELLSSMNITFVDLSDTFSGILDRQSIRLGRMDVHPNVRGHEMIYESLYERLRANPEAWSKLVGPAFADNQYSVPRQ